MQDFHSAKHRFLSLVKLENLGPLILNRCLIVILCLQVRTKGGIFDWQRPFDPRKNAYGDIHS